MAYLTQKKVNGSVYYYAEQRVWVDGKSKRQWQKYLGSLNKIIKAIEGQTPDIKHSIVFEFGGVAAYLYYLEQLGIEAQIDSLLPKREQGLSVGRYMAIAAINRGLHSVSKNSMWNWYEDTVLLSYWNNVKKNMLSSQRFWDNMDLIPDDKIVEIWTKIISNAINVKQIDLSKICFDGTNYYTFISSFNSRNSISQRGKNKQGRRDLRQVNYALFCSQQDHIPLYFDVYEGNRHDSPEFYKIIDDFANCFQTLDNPHSNMTVIFDKGNNSEENIAKLTKQKLHYIGSLKLNQVKELEAISNKDSCLKSCKSSTLEDYKVYRIQRKVFKQNMTLLLIYNPGLYDSQLKTVLKDINNCITKLSELKQKLQDRIDGITTKGRKPTESSVKTSVSSILKRQYMKQIITVEYDTKKDISSINYQIDELKLKEIRENRLGKKILFTDNHQWKTEDIIMAYNNQAVVENLFKETKNRRYSSWWPQYHYTDQKIKVHGLYCTITLLIRSLIERDLRLNNIKISMERLHDELAGIKQIVSLFKSKDKSGHKSKVKSLSKMNELQNKLYKMFEMKQYT
jgi:transposase